MSTAVETSRKHYRGTSVGHNNGETWVIGPVLFDVVVYEHGPRERDGRMVNIQPTYSVEIDGRHQFGGPAHFLDADGLPGYDITIKGQPGAQNALLIGVTPYPEPNMDCAVCGSRTYRGADRCGGCGSPRPGIAGWWRPTEPEAKPYRPVPEPTATCSRCGNALFYRNYRWRSVYLNSCGDTCASQTEGIVYPEHMPAIEVVDTTQLAEGDVIAHHGMVLLLANRRTYDCAPRLVRFAGVILNFGQVTDPFIISHAYDENEYEAAAWGVQGNDLARWARITPSEEAV